MIDDRGDWGAGAFLSAFGKTLTQLERYAEAALLEAHEILQAALGAEHKRMKAINTLVELYEPWAAADPNQAYAEKPAECRAKLPALQPATESPAEPATDQAGPQDNGGE